VRESGDYTHVGTIVILYGAINNQPGRVSDKNKFHNINRKSAYLEYLKSTLLTMQPVLEVSIYTLLKMAFIWQLISAAIYLVGLLTIGVYLYDNLKSLVSIIKAVLEPYFQPHLPRTLVDKFGQWAGECFDRKAHYIHEFRFIHRMFPCYSIPYLHTLTSGVCQYLRYAFSVDSLS